MIEQWAAALEATQLAAALRGSAWSYPLVNAAHILGVALLIGSTVPLDLRLLGMWPSVPLAPLWRVLTRTGAIGLALAIVCGLLLFITRASEYVASDLFAAKMAVVAIGVINAVAARRLVLARALETQSPRSARNKMGRLVASLSIVSWLTALILGRLIGYF